MAACCGEPELQLESAALLGGRREVPEVVEPAFAGGDHPGIAQEFGQAAGVGVPQSRRVMGVHSGSRAEHPGIAASEGNRLVRVVERAAGHDQGRDAGGSCPREHGVAVRVEAVVREIGADVDQRGHAYRAVSGGAQRRRDRLSRRAQRRQEPADHADDDRDDEPVHDQRGRHGERGTRPA